MALFVGNNYAFYTRRWTESGSYLFRLLARRGAVPACVGLGFLRPGLAAEERLGRREAGDAGYVHDFTSQSAVQL